METQIVSGQMDEFYQFMDSSFAINGLIKAPDVRVKMTEFWKSHSQGGTEEEMMLDTNADVLGKEDVPEILSMLPQVKGKDVLELGSGIGRFTGRIAAQAKSVVSVDFMENFVRCNRENNGHLTNITFLQADATALDYPSQSFDLVFSNWLLMYLEESEVENLFLKIFDWLRPGGFCYFRESCFHQSGDRSRASNPTEYRKPSTYNDILRRVGLNSSDFSLKLVMSKSVQTYIKLKSNRNQICWLVQKVPSNEFDDSKGCRVFGENFENALSSVHVVERLERCMGTGCISSGEAELFEGISGHLRLESDSRVLCLGCGLGWKVFRMARERSAEITGIDPSATTVALCLERANRLDIDNVQFQMNDFNCLALPQQEFDCVLYCTSANVENHRELYDNIKSAMKPSGRLVVMEYCFGPWNSEDSTLMQHARRCKYHILDGEHYKQVLSEAGFDVVVRDDVSHIKLAALKKHLQKLEGNDTLMRTLKDSMENKINWLSHGRLQLLCFVCQLQPKPNISA